MIVTLKNPDVTQLEKTYLSLSYNFGTTSIEVKNNQQFTANQRILLGEPGLAYTEVVTAGTSGADGITIPISATLYSHEADTPVYLLQFDQAKFYRATSIDGSYSLLPGCPVNIDFTSEDLSTGYNDNTVSSGDYYQVTVYNSITTLESGFTDPIPAITGWTRKQVGYVMDQMYTELSDSNEDNLTRDEMLGYMNEVNDDLTAQTVKPYNFLYTRQVFARVGGNNTLAWPTDSVGNNLMRKFHHMDYNFRDPSTTPVTNDTNTVTVTPFIYFRNRYTINQDNTTTPQEVNVSLVSGGKLVVGTQYYYQITATYPQGGETGPSTEVTVTSTTGQQTVDLSWTSPIGATGFNVYRGLTSGGEVFLASSTTTSFMDSGSINPGLTVPPGIVQDDMVQEMALNEATQSFDYYPASLTNAQSVWYLYYWSYFSELTSEGDFLETPTPKIYKHYISYKYYLKKSSTDESYIPIYKQHQSDYVYERARLKSQDRRDLTPRRFGNEGWVYKSFRR